MDTIADIMFACCILHNMVLEEERDVTGLENILAAPASQNVAIHRGLSFEELATNTVELQNRDTHFGL